MAPQPYAVAADAAAALVKVHKRTFFLTIAQIIIIVSAILIILRASASVGIGVYILVAGSSHLRDIPGYDQYVKQFGDAVRQSGRIAVLHHRRVPILVIGIVDLILGIIVGRPSNIARWIIIVLDVLSIICASSTSRARETSAARDLILLVYLALQVIVLYAMADRPGDADGTSREEPIALAGERVRR